MIYQEYQNKYPILFGFYIERKAFLVGRGKAMPE